MIEYQYKADIAAGLGDGWHVGSDGRIHNSSKNFHFYVGTSRSDSTKAHIASAHNGLNRYHQCITETGYPNKEKFPSFNVTVTRGAGAAIAAINRIMPEAERLSAVVDSQLKEENARAESIAKRGAELVQLTNGKLKEKNQPGCYETRGIPNLDRLEVYENSILLETGYTSMPDWKAKAILKILMAESPETSLQ